MDTIQIADMAGARRLTAVASPAEAGVRGADFLLALDSFDPIAPTDGNPAPVPGAAPPAGQADDDAHDMSASDPGDWLPPATPPPAIFQPASFPPASFQPASFQPASFQPVGQMDIVDGHQSASAPAASEPEQRHAFSQLDAKAGTGTAGLGDSEVSVPSSESTVSASHLPPKRPVPAQAPSGDQKAAVSAGHTGQSNDPVDIVAKGIADEIAASQGPDTKAPRAPTEAATMAPAPPLADTKTPVPGHSDPTQRFKAKPDDGPGVRVPEEPDNSPARDVGPTARGAAPEALAGIGASVDKKHLMGGAPRIAVRHSDPAGGPAPTPTALGAQASPVGPQEGSTPPDPTGRIVDPDPPAKGPAQADTILQVLDPAGLSQPPADAKSHERTAESPPGQIGHRVLPAGLGHHLAETAARFPGQPVEVTLSPEELGKVRMTLTTTDGGLTLSLVADRPETLALMRRHIDQLAQDFRDLGFQNLSFSFAQGRDPGRGSAAAVLTDAEMIPTDAAPALRRPALTNSLPPVPADGLDIRM